MESVKENQEEKQITVEEEQVEKQPAQENETDKKTNAEELGIDWNNKEQVAEEATKYGAIPKEEWKGDEKEWKDPETFLRESIKRTPALLNQIKKMRGVIKSNNMLIENLHSNLKRQKEELEPKLKQAFDEGDYDSYNKFQKREKDINREVLKLEETKQELEPSEPSKQNRENPVLQYQVRTWMNKNPKYVTDLNFRNKVDNLYNGYMFKYPKATVTQILDTIDIALKNKKNKSSNIYNSSSPTQSSSNMGNVKKTKTFENLNSSAQATCREYMKQGGKKEHYVKYADESLFT